MFKCQMLIRLHFCWSVPPEFLRSFGYIFITFGSKDIFIKFFHKASGDNWGKILCCSCSLIRHRWNYIMLQSIIMKAANSHFCWLFVAFNFIKFGYRLLSTSFTEYLSIIEAKSSVVPVRSLGIVESHSKLERQSGAEWGGKLYNLCNEYCSW